ncbi:MAG TPA: hypothetical protein VNT79_11880, partial [Phycisphaerae bacterium]|nr:hypothetical protein [Phycisphaerae bacterium]
QLVGRVFLSVAVALAALTVGLTFVVFLLRGIDGAVVALVGREWLGHLLTGVLGLGGLFAAFKIRRVARDRIRREKKGREYELRKADQRDRIGRDVDGSERRVA